MVPGGVVGGAFLLSLIPGWLFLRRSESARRPRDQTALQEILELVGVGLLTTGLAASAGLLIFPDIWLEHDHVPKSSGDVRALVGITFGWLGCSVLLAELAAWVLRKASKAPNSELTVSVWWAALRPERVPPGHLPWAIVKLNDDSTVEGVLSDYTLSAEAAHRDIALRAPIQFTPDGGKTKKAPYDVTVVPAEQIKHLSVSYVTK